jgi:hypothetical protein
MAKDPAARYPSATELIQDVRRSFPTPVEPGPVGVTRTTASPRPAAPAGSPAPDPTAPGPTAPAWGRGVAPTPPAPAAPPPAAPRPAPAPAARAPARRAPPARRHPATQPLLAFGALAVVVVAGLLIGNATSGGDAAPDKGKAISAGSLSVRAPTSWQQADQPVKIPGLTLKQAASLLPADAGKDATVTVGKSNGTGSELLPPRLLRGLDSPPQSEAVKLGDIEALRYAALGPAKLKEGTLRLYAAPITDGVATIACVVPPNAATGSLTDACDRTAASLRLTKGRSYPLGPDKQYQGKLNDVVHRLNSATKKGVATLRKADTPAAQAKAAGSLRTAYLNAADSLRGATHNPQVSGANDEIVAALKALAARYGQLAAAARADNPSAYGRARYFIGQGEKRLRRALAAVSG